MKLFSHQVVQKNTIMPKNIMHTEFPGQPRRRPDYLFKSKQRKLNNESISITLGGVNLIPSDNVKYLGLHFDKYLSSDLQINQLSKKLSRANDILSKLRHFVTKQTLISVYYSLFYSHLLYGCPVWSLTKNENFHSITILQKSVCE